MGAVFAAMALLIIVLLLVALAVGLPLLILGSIFLRRRSKVGKSIVLPLLGIIFGTLLIFPAFILFIVSPLISMIRGAFGAGLWFGWPALPLFFG